VSSSRWIGLLIGASGTEGMAVMRVLGECAEASIEIRANASGASDWISRAPRENAPPTYSAGHLDDEMIEATLKS
jgi:hypothetical protein